MNRGIRIICLVFLMTAGCASKWTMNSQTSETQLLWPYLPENPKVKYSMSINGFEETTSSVMTFLFGKGRTEIIRPVAVATAGDGRMAIADTGDKSVHLFVPSAERYLKITSAKKEELLSPVSVIFDHESRLYVSDSALGRIFVFDSEGAYLFSIDKAGENRLQRPTGLAYCKDKNILYAIDTHAHQIYAFDRTGAFVSSFGGNGTEDGQFNFPTHIFISEPKLLYVTDSMNFRIQIFNSSADFKTSFGQHGNGSGDFAMPKGIAVDKDGIIYVVETLFDNIQLFNEYGEFLLTIGGRGSGHGEFWLPSGIFIDDNQKLYICDTFNRRIQVFDILKNNNGL